jgi:hypothetical protein
MKTFIQRLPLAFVATLLASVVSFSQTSDQDDDSKFYLTSGGNGLMLSLAQIKTTTGNTPNAIPRLTMFFNLGTNANYDFGRNFGMFSGVNLTNVGMITEFDNDVKLKQRVYAVGVPLGIKIGDLKKFFVYGGGEVAFAVNYKEKRFEGGDKVAKFNEWFSERSNAFMPSVFAGFQTKTGFGLKVQYYLNDFLNQSFNVGSVRPYANIEQSKLFFVSLSYSFDKKKSKTHYTKKGRRVKVDIG